MSIPSSAKWGLVAMFFITSFLYLCVPDNAQTAAGSLSEKFLMNAQGARSFLKQRTTCFLKACFNISSLSTGLFLETIFQFCLSKEIEMNFGETKLDDPLIHIAVVACGDRLEETLISIKSSLMFTKRSIFYHIFTEEELRSGFIDGIESWPERYRSNLQYQLYPISYPEDGNAKNWKKLFKPCASQRLFLPMVLSKDIDSIIYVDTDIIFLTDVLQLWSIFTKFNSTQLSALSIEHEDKRMGWYSRFARHPYYGITGVNSGVMLMNLTRIRKVRYKNDIKPSLMMWKDMLLPLYNKYRYNITWGDQDLLNIVFHHNPDMLYVFSCEWNYRPDHCMYGQLCKIAKDTGVKVVHGCRRVYHNEKQPTFKAVYETIKSYKFGDELHYLNQVMEKNLKETENTYCGKEYESILKGLSQNIEQLNDSMLID
ncbi:glucoside xylosyltransferase 1-like isoform X1 [Styela clava]